MPAHRIAPIDIRGILNFDAPLEPALTKPLPRNVFPAALPSVPSAAPMVWFFLVDVCACCLLINGTFKFTCQYFLWLLDGQRQNFCP